MPITPPTPSTPPEQVPSRRSPPAARIPLVIAAGAAVIAAGAAAYFYFRTPLQPAQEATTIPKEQTSVQELPATTAAFGEEVQYRGTQTVIAPEVSRNFSTSEITNLAAMEKKFGFTFTAAEKQSLEARKFVVKNLLDTSIRPTSVGKYDLQDGREFVQLYNTVAGPIDAHDRSQANTVFYSADVFLNAFNNLYTELLKEMENEEFYPAVRDLSQTFFEAATKKLAAAGDADEARKWRKVRNYFAVPYAIFTTAARPLTQNDYYSGGTYRNPGEVQQEFAEKDATVDTKETVSAFIKTLKLDAASEQAVLEDIGTIYDAENKALPQVFQEEYDAYAQQEQTEFQVDFSQFTPRGTYTSSSLRRQYFRGVKWFIMVPFFLKSPDLTTYAFAVSQLMAEHPDALKDYDKLEKTIDFMVGSSDDLMPVDYLRALAAAKDAPDSSAAAMEYLVKARDPKIKDLAASYPAAGAEQSNDVLLKTKGMRFFSGKFIIDSYWTGYLTQGDEAPRPGYTQKLPPMASALEVMALLGSSYAETQIPKLDFYGEHNAQAIAQALGDLKKQNGALTDNDWRRNIYTTWLWTLRSIFDWQNIYRDDLPTFMQSVAWQAKSLMTAAASWTELRHATILYAKQSFAELGAGIGECDPRQIPEPPKGYIEPQQEMFARLAYMAKRLNAGLQAQGFALDNKYPLEKFIGLLDKVRGYVDKELGNTVLHENIRTEILPAENFAGTTSENGSDCTVQVISESDWEMLRRGIVEDLLASTPQPVEGPVITAKDRRAALVADIHTGQDSGYPARILYEGVGVPYVIFTAIKDANGPRLAVGFMSSQYEFTQPYGGQRLTDEKWQENFYLGSDPTDAFRYTNAANWPKTNVWYAPLFDLTK